MGGVLRGCGSGSMHDERRRRRRTVVMRDGWRPNMSPRQTPALKQHNTNLGKCGLQRHERQSQADDRGCGRAEGAAGE